MCCAWMEFGLQVINNLTRSRTNRRQAYQCGPILAMPFCKFPNSPRFTTAAMASAGTDRNSTKAHKTPFKPNLECCRSAVHLCSADAA